MRIDTSNLSRTVFLFLITCSILQNMNASEKVTLCRIGNENIIVQTMIQPPTYNVDPTGKKDSTAGIQKAINEVINIGGGILFLPRGKYRINGSLHFRNGVQLRGESSEAGSKQTLILAYGGRGKPNGPALFNHAGHDSYSVQSLAVYYPEQIPDDIKPYPPTFYDGMNGIVKDIVLYNSWIGFRYDYFNATMLENIRGTVLKVGIDAQLSLEFSWVRNVEFNSSYWIKNQRALSGKRFTSLQVKKINTFIKEYLTGLWLGGIDMLILQGFHAPGAYQPILMDSYTMKTKPEPKTGAFAKRRYDVVQNKHGVGGVLWQVDKDITTIKQSAYWSWNRDKMPVVNVDLVPEAKSFKYPKHKHSIPAKKKLAIIGSKNYPAKGDGTMDATSTFQKALKNMEKAGGGIVYVPRGRWRITKPLVLGKKVELHGPMGFANRIDNNPAVIEIDHGENSVDPTRDEAALLLRDGAVLRGLTLRHPDQLFETGKAIPFPYIVRGKGKNISILDCIFSSYNAIDFLMHPCDNHLVKGVWGTAFNTGIAVGGGTKNGRLEMVGITWAMAANYVRAHSKAEGNITHTIKMEHVRNSTAFKFGDVSQQTTWGLACFDSRYHMHFIKQNGRECRDSNFYVSQLDAGYEACIKAEAGRDVNFIGLMATGGGGREFNWIVSSPNFKGPFHIYGKTVAEVFHNKPLGFTDQQIKFYDELSLTTGKKVQASHAMEGFSAEKAIDRNVFSYWQAKAGSTLTVDLGKSHILNRFRVDSAGYVLPRKETSLKAARLEVSEDGIHFKVATEFNDLKKVWRDMAIIPQTRARYVRLVVTDPGEDKIIQVSSFNVYSDH